MNKPTRKEKREFWRKMSKVINLINESKGKMKLSEKLQEMHENGDIVKELPDEAKLIEQSIDSLAAENKRLDLCIASKTDIANQLKDELTESFGREYDAKKKHDEVLDKYLKLKFQVEKMLIHGSWYVGAVEGNPHIDFEEVEREIVQIIDWRRE
jgi:predicted RNase H-like nuclease (RuvC/YqgF family)